MKCRTCGTTLSSGALLCGECGTSAIAPRPTLGDTAHHDRRALLAAIAAERPSASPAGGIRPAPARDAEPAQAPAPAPSHAATPGSPAAAALPRPDGPAHAAAPAGSPQQRSRALYSLVFSTGESIRVSGGGLVGRNPVAAPGEHPEYLVQIVDPARSVSKTHLEFGVDDDGFWVADRGSSNGTRLVPHTAAPVELPPGERTRVQRGSRVGLADQYFDLH